MFSFHFQRDNRTSIDFSHTRTRTHAHTHLKTEMHRNKSYNKYKAHSLINRTQFNCRQSRSLDCNGNWAAGSS